MALKESERALDAINIYHDAAIIPEVTSYCSLLGRENLEEIKYLKMEDGRIIGTSERLVGKPVLHWHLSDDGVRRYTEEFGFDQVSKVLASKKRTKFQETLLDALILYSRSTREKDLAGKLVYTLVAIESILLRDKNESIQQNIGERMAFINTNVYGERLEIIRNLKAAYALRSRFIHHGHTVEERQTMYRFMTNAWALFTTLADNSQRFESKDELIDNLEAMKMP